MPSPASADGYLCVVRTIRFNTPEIDKNTESGAILTVTPHAPMRALTGNA